MYKGVPHTVGESTTAHQEKLVKSDRQIAMKERGYVGTASNAFDKTAMDNIAKDPEMLSRDMTTGDMKPDMKKMIFNTEYEPSRLNKAKEVPLVERAKIAADNLMHAVRLKKEE
ncbi:hypothetical protein HK101_008018 [Irineochytrium annulatum]|nr:hypothetical protein HK101_008018 [Irineochytrium annulatum]